VPVKLALQEPVTSLQLLLPKAIARLARPQKCIDMEALMLALNLAIGEVRIQATTSLPVSTLQLVLDTFLPPITTLENEKPDTKAYYELTERLDTVELGLTSEENVQMLFGMLFELL
jgi:hypothetical protein